MLEGCVGWAGTANIAPEHLGSNLGQVGFRKKLHIIRTVSKAKSTGVESTQIGN